MLFGDKGIIGLDVGSRYIKAVQLKGFKWGYRLECIGITQLSPDLIIDGSIIDSLRVIDAIKELISKAQIKVKNTAIAISGHSSVIMKIISLPQMSEEELGESIKFEAERYIPFDIDDVSLDFQIVGFKERQNQIDVLIVAAKKDKINEYVFVVREAGLNPVIVDVNAFALENMYEVNYEAKKMHDVALVNVGASTANINILKDGISIFMRDISIGSNLHTEALQKEFALPYSEAERLKHGGVIAGVSEEKIEPILNFASEDIIAEILRSFKYFREEATYEEDIKEIILSGGCAMVKGFASLLSQMIGIDVKIAAPLKNIRAPETFDRNYLGEIAPMIAVATGLALRRIGDR